jgi:signal recognition particle subunit SRP54
MAKRILGMGDVVGLIEKAQEAAKSQDLDEAAVERLGTGAFTLEDFMVQITQVRKMGGLAGVLNSLPGAAKMKGLDEHVDERQVDRIEAIIRSMTPRERRDPRSINGSRRARIARGAGVEVSDVNRLLKQFAETKKLMKQFQSMGGKGRRRMRMPGLPGGFGVL